MWDTEKADQEFSLMVRKRDPICKRCRWKKTTDCSHYWERGHSATRFDPENGDGLCRECHTIWEGRKNGYKEFKIKQLGRKRYEEMERRHNGIMKRDEAVENFRKLIERT